MGCVRVCLGVCVCVPEPSSETGHIHTYSTYVQLIAENASAQFMTQFCVLVDCKSDEARAFSVIYCRTFVSLLCLCGAGECAIVTRKIYNADDDEHVALIFIFGSHHVPYETE